MVRLNLIETPHLLEQNEWANFDEADKDFWEHPERHALVKENNNGLDYYLIFIIEPTLMMKLCDDFDYALRLSKKMMESGVSVFENVDSLLAWYNSGFVGS